MNSGATMAAAVLRGANGGQQAAGRAGAARRTSVARLPRRGRSRGDLLVGALVAVALHGALWASGAIFPKRPDVVDPMPVAAGEEMVLCRFAAAEELPAAEPSPPETLGEAAAGDGDTARTTIVPLQLLGGRDCSWRAVCGRIAPALAGGGAVGFTVDRNALCQTGRGAAFVVFDLAELDQPPVVLAQPLPQYPSTLLRTGAAGEVLVTFVVEADGRVRAVRAVSATHTEFEVPALQAVARWKFRPGRKDGRAVATRVEVPITFSVPEKRG